MTANALGAYASFVDALLVHAAREPNRPAIGTEAGLLTYGQLANAIFAATARCEQAGLRPGVPAALLLGDPVWQICMIAALYRLGVPSVSIALNHAPQCAALGIDTILHDGDAPAGHGGRIVKVEPDWFERAANQSAARGLRFDADELCRIAFSTGTTGQPKPIALSSRIVWDRLTTYSFRGGFAACERIYCGPQIGSQFGFAIAFAALIYGKMVCFADNMQTALPVMALYKVDLAIVSVFQLSAIAEFMQKKPGGLGALREIQAGGAMISNALLERARASLSCAIVATYASTEAGTVAFGAVEQLGALRSEGAVGFVVPWASVEICDESGRVLPPGRDGSVRIVTVGLAPRYEPGMKTVVATEPFLPGDYGRLLGNGMLVVAGRTTEIVNIGGIKLSPDRFEEVILQVPGVRDAAVLVMNKDAALPQVWAAIVADATVDVAEVSRRGGEVAGNVALSIVKRVEAIPRSGDGKILRDQLRQELLLATG